MSKPSVQSDDDPPELEGGGPRPQRPGPKPHEPTKVDRDTVMAMVAAGVAIDDIARVRGMSSTTLRRYYRDELETGTTVLNTMAILEHIKRIRSGDFAAIKWWEQARMGWSEKLTVEDNKADKPLRVIIELVGDQPPRAQSAVPVIEAKPAQPASRLPSTIVEFKGGKP